MTLTEPEDQIHVYFQRVLGSDSDFTAKMLSYVAAMGCLFLALPPAILGGIAKTTNFTAAGYSGPATLRDQDRSRVLPFSIRYLTSPTLSVLGMIGILAAVMSSVDSSMLSASAMVTWNVYHALMRPKASEKEVALTLRLMVCAIGASATYLALSVQSVFNLWILCSDVVYVLLFPQLVCVFYIKHTNAYGSASGEEAVRFAVIASRSDDVLETFDYQCYRSTEQELLRSFSLRHVRTS
ncbi:high-affinity choline transporter 1-like [Rhipicephalus microplus]|uniref:high-affinity choline transporter 1-like n=1 Tax=Rhipicephalus microplus TaxID=6941 RepID=UPI003F6D93D4